MVLDDIFVFLINFFGRCISFVFNLDITLTSSLKINFGLFLVSCCIIGLSIKLLIDSICGK